MKNTYYLNYIVSRTQQIKYVLSLSNKNCTDFKTTLKMITFNSVLFLLVAMNVLSHKRVIKNLFIHFFAL